MKQKLQYKNVCYVLIFIILTPIFNVCAAPSINMTGSVGQTTPELKFTDSSGNVLWQFSISSAATILSQNIVFYKTGLTHIRGFQLPDQNTTLAGLNVTQTFTGTQTINSLKLGGDANVGSNALSNAGHKSSLPSTSGILCQTNQTTSCGTSSGGRTLLGNTTTTDSSSNDMSVSFSPTGYSRIAIEIWTGTLTGTSTIQMQFNGDTTAHYTWSKIVAATATTGTSASFCLFDTTASTLQRQLHVEEMVSPSSAFQGIHWEGQTVAAAVSTAPLLLHGSCVWSGAQTITQVDVKTTTSTNNFPAGAFVYVYGS